MIPKYDDIRDASTQNDNHQPFQEGSRVYIQDLDGNGNPGTVFKNGAGNAVGDANDPLNAERMPKIIQTSDGRYIVTWVSVASTGTTPETLLISKYNTDGTIYSSGFAWNAYPVSAIGYTHINSYDVIPDQAGGMMILMAVSDQNNHWRLLCQHIIDNTGTPERYWVTGYWQESHEQMLEVASYDLTKNFIYNPIIRYNPYNSVSGGVASYDLAWGRIIDSNLTSPYTCNSDHPIRPYLFLQRISLTPYDSITHTTPCVFIANGWNPGIFLAEDNNKYAPFYMTPAAQYEWGGTEAILLREENWGSCNTAIPRIQPVARLRLHWFDMTHGVD
ncbi:MAG: hypothetical protein ACREBW_03285, partial [Candidatus Micrarchaeaceae archaeon]